MTDRKRQSGGQATAAARLAKMRAKRAESGLVRVDVTVPVTKKEEIKAIAKAMCEENHQSPV